MNPAQEPTPREFAWYVGEDAEISGLVTAVFSMDAAKEAAEILLAQGKLLEPVDLYVRPDQNGARWKRFKAFPRAEVLARV